MFTARDSVPSYSPTLHPTLGHPPWQVLLETRTHCLGMEVKRAPYKEKIFILKSII